MGKVYDIAVIGGGIIGMATAYYLSKNQSDIIVIEKETLGSGSTSRCIGGIRQQFSTPASIRIMKENIQLFSEMESEFGFTVDFQQSGYLLLAHDENLLNIFKNNIAIQKKEGVDVSLVSREEAKDIVPELNTDGLLGAAYCPEDGQAYPFYVLKGYKEGIEQNGGTIVTGNAVIHLKKESHFKLELKDGSKIEAEKVLLAAGPWTKEFGSQLGLNLSIFPERHEAMITSRMEKFFQPMIVDYRKDGCYFQQLLTGQVIGCFTPIPNVPGIREDVSPDFLPQMAKRMIRLVPELKKASILRHWSGSYSMTPDGSPIVDETEIENLYVSAGMSGHGFMFGPALGKYMAHFMQSGEWMTDFSEFSINRSFDSTETLK